MDRRELLRYTAVVTGAAISAPLVSALLSGCNTEAVTNASSYAPQFFNDRDFSLLEDLIDAIIPETDSPSASQVGVARNIDHMVAVVYSAEDREEYKTRFAVLARHAREQDFEQLDAENQLLVLRSIDASEEADLESVREAYLDLKQQAVGYYLSTEEIAENYLNYLPIPGAYEACLRLSDVGGKAWAI